MKNEIEHIFKDKLYNAEVIPSAGLFDTILAKRAAKKRRAAWLWSAAAICTIGLGTWFLAADTTAILPLVTKKENIESSFSDKSDNITIEESEILLSEREDERTIEILNNENTSEYPITNSTLSVTLKSDSEVLIKKLPEESNSTSSSQTANKIEEKEDLPASIVNSEYADFFQRLYTADQDVDRSKGRLFFGEKKQEVAADYALPLHEKAPTPEAPAPSRIPETKNQTPASDLPKQDLSPDTTTSPLPIRKLATLNRWSLEASTGLGIGKGLINSNDPAYSAMRNTTDKSQLTHAFDVRAIYRLNPHWNLQAGITYTKRKEAFTFTQEDTWEYIDREEVRTRTIVHPVLGTIEEKYTVNVTDSSLVAGKNLSSTNSYMSITIPISIERMIPLNAKWTVLTRGGFSASISNQSTGQILASSDATDLSDIPSRKNGVHGLHLGIGVMYEANKRITLIAYPTGTLDLLSRMNSDAIFEQRDLSILTHFGLRVNL
jgi:hypothetical protein